MPTKQPQRIPQPDEVVLKDDEIGEYLKRLNSGQLTAVERREGVARRQRLVAGNLRANEFGKDSGEDDNEDSGENEPTDSGMTSDECPDENMPND